MLRKRTAALAVAAALGAVTLGYAGAEYYPIQKAHAAPAATAASASPVAAQAGRSLPDFTGLVETQGPAVVHISVAQRAAGAGATRDLPVKPGDPMYEFFRRFQVPTPDAQPMPRQGQGSGFIISGGRLHPHQRARRGRRRRAHGEADRQARVQGQGGRRRPAYRRRGGEDRGERAADGQARRPVAAQGGRVGGGDRLAVRPREHRHRRHRERQGARAARRGLRAVHPDRRRDQPRQLRRAALQHGRRGRGHQLADLQPDRRLHGPLVRRSRSTSR